MLCNADSEGVEGKFYTWKKKEIDEILGKESDLFCAVCDVSENGNWENTNILWLPETMEETAKKININQADLEKTLFNCREKLLHCREKRVRPSTDDKILLGWNALTISALCKCFAAINNEEYLQLAGKNIGFLEENFIDKLGAWFHTWKNNDAKYFAFLDDYAYLIEAYIHLQEVTGNANYLMKAKNLTEFVKNNFEEKESGFFYFTSINQQDIVVRKKEVYDGATPSGNSVMAFNLYYLSFIFDIAMWRNQSEKMVTSLQKAIVNYPTSFANWASLLHLMIYGMKEIAITGNHSKEFLSAINGKFIPDKIIQSSQKQNDEFPLLKNRWNKNGITEIYLCQNYICKQPVQTVNEFLDLLNQAKNSFK
ncbi:MAG: thioredoxin domain-containing protein [Chitinophagaceae bacterium]